MIRLQQIRLDRHITVDQLAALAKVAPKTIRNVENGRPVEDTTLIKLAKALDVPTSALLLPAVFPEMDTTA